MITCSRNYLTFWYLRSKPLETECIISLWRPKHVCSVFPTSVFCVSMTIVFYEWEKVFSCTRRILANLWAVSIWIPLNSGTGGWSSSIETPSLLITTSTRHTQSYQITQKLRVLSNRHRPSLRYRTSSQHLRCTFHLFVPHGTHSCSY